MQRLNIGFNGLPPMVNVVNGYNSILKFKIFLVLVFIKSDNI